jgi:hypothetical protein
MSLPWIPILVACTRGPCHSVHIPGLVCQSVLSRASSLHAVRALVIDRDPGKRSATSATPEHVVGRATKRIKRPTRGLSRARDTVSTESGSVKWRAVFGIRSIHVNEPLDRVWRRHRQRTPPTRMRRDLRMGAGAAAAYNRTWAPLVAPAAY